ncbi:unnamed protein product [Somion occarium]|uniref:Histone-lysine N-methyltransferase, H3 lysine-79 specific n=1 Tax=Somion occarium TaxID=3059160 RepID=A0ABP1CRC4_9APHY
MYARRPAASNLGFFSKSFSVNSTSTPQTTQTTTNVVVKTRLVPKSTNTGAVKVVARDATPAAASSSSRAPSATPSETSKKRKPVADPFSEILRVKKPRLSRSPAQSRAASARPSEEPSTRASSVAPSRQDSPLTRRQAPWIDEDGQPGSEMLSCEITVRNIMKGYKAFFKNPSDAADTSFEPHITNYPVTELEYPNTSASERFILLEPKDKDHYNPIFCLQKTIHTIVEHYLTPVQQSLFGSVPDKSLSHIWDDAERDSSPDSDSTQTPDESESSILLASMCSSSSLLETFLRPASASPAQQTFNFPRRLQSAINRRNGPQFLQVMEGINAFLRFLKYPHLPSDLFDHTPPNGLMSTIKAKSAVPHDIIMRIIDETYQRAVGPHVDSLKKYEAFTAGTYGELMPSFISRLIKETRLTEDSLFLDLGSGVGNVVLQASLETGCRSFGVELLDAPAGIAQSQLEQLKIRCRMWGVKLGEVELEHGDMLASKKLDSLLSKADVLLVNNKVFDEPLNEAIKGKLLDLKEGAIVISLRHFSPPKSSFTGRNVDDISSIFQVSERKFPSGSVSWTGSSDHYYIHKVDRAAYALNRNRYESSRATSVRSTRSRR